MEALKDTNAAKRACADYAFSVAHEKCEVTRYLIEDRDFARWVSRDYAFNPLQVHHIHKRQPPAERNHFCNLIRISLLAHSWIHDKAPYVGELCCWKSKLDKFRQSIESDIAFRRDPVTDPARMEFHVPSLDKIVEPMRSFHGRVCYLRDQVNNEKIKSYVDDILRFIEENDGAQRDDSNR